MNPSTWSWPFVLTGVAVVLAVGLLVAWGVMMLERRNRAEARAEGIQQVVGEALAREPLLAGASVLPVATLPVEGRPTLELTGYVPSAAGRERAVRVAERAVRGVRPGMQVVDRLEVLPAPAERGRLGA